MKCCRQASHEKKGFHLKKKMKSPRIFLLVALKRPGRDCSGTLLQASVKFLLTDGGG